MKTIKELRDAANAAEKALNAARKELFDALKASCSVKEGDIVVSTRPSHKGEQYIVREVDIDWMLDFGGTPCVIGSPKKKDGTFGTARRNLFNDWKRP